MLTRSVLIYLSSQERLKEFATHFKLFKKLTTRFIAGENINEAIAAIRDLNARGCSASFDHLNESVTSPVETEAEVREYLDVLARIDESGIDSNVSIKLTQLGLDISPVLCEELLVRILRRAAELGNFVRIDMEGSAYTERTLELALAMHARYPNCGVVLQSYLYRTAADVERMNQAGVRVRLVKGAYDEPPAIAYPRKADVDDSFRRAMQALLRQGNYPAIATHDEGLISETIAFAAAEGIGSDRFPPQPRKRWSH